MKPTPQLNGSREFTPDKSDLFNSEEMTTIKQALINALLPDPCNTPESVQETEGICKLISKVARIEHKMFEDSKEYKKYLFNKFE